MSKKNKYGAKSVFTNPIFLLTAFIVVLMALFFFSKSAGNNGADGKITDYDETEGKITLIEYGDYQCPACVREHSIVKRILADYEGKVILEYRHFPLPFHEYAQKAAVAAECARDQGKFNEMHDRLYESNGSLSVDNLKKYASEIGLNADTFNSCLDANTHLDKINSDKNKGVKDNIAGTPTFYINGKLLVNSENSNYLPRMEDFKREIDREMSKK